MSIVNEEIDDWLVVVGGETNGGAMGTVVSRLSRNCLPLAHIIPSITCDTFMRLWFSMVHVYGYNTVIDCHHLAAC